MKIILSIVCVCKPVRNDNAQVTLRSAKSYFAGTFAGGRTGRSAGGLEVSALAFEGISLVAALFGCALPAARFAFAGRCVDRLQSRRAD
jgi:hypothetical protein